MPRVLRLLHETESHLHRVLRCPLPVQFCVHRVIGTGAQVRPETRGVDAAAADVAELAVWDDVAADRFVEVGAANTDAPNFRYSTT